MTTYWHDVSKTQLSRRRALAASGATVAAAALLAACGSSKSSGGGSADQNKLVSPPVDTSKQAKRGGTSKWYLGAEPAGFDIHVGGAPKNAPKNLVYSNLVGSKPGYLQAQDYSDFIPDIAQSWEWSPDALSLTVKIQPNARWHNKPPVNGRPFDMDDLMFSWQRFTAKGRDRGAVA